MKRIAALRGAFGARYIEHLQSRAYSETATSGAGDSNGVPNTPLPSSTGLKINEQSRTIETPAGSLPISPLMDPSWQKQTKKSSKPKLRANSISKSRFRRQLARNPYAQALSTPSRTCALTGAVLPRYFLQDFSLVQHPETKDPWWLPSSLAAARSQPNHSKPPSDAVPEEPPSSAENVATAPSPKEGSTRPRGPSAYILSRQDLLKSLVTPKSTYYNQQRRLGRKTTSAPLISVLNRATWSPNMDILVLELLRRRIVEDLLYLSEKSVEENRKYLIKLSSLNDLEGKHEPGCVLHMASTIASEGGNFQDSVALPSSTIEGKDEIPLHDITQLLGTEHVARLRGESPMLSEGSLFLLGRRRSAETQLKLWKLQGYLAQHENTP